MWFARHEGGGVGTVESRSLIEEDHLFGFSFGVQIGNDFEWGVALDEGYLHVEGADVHAENGFGGSAGDGGSEEQERIEHFHDMLPVQCYNMLCCACLSMGWRL